MTTNPNELIDRAYAIAFFAHGSQARKYTGLPYMIHLLRVAETVQSVRPDDPTMIAAAILHDTLEDTHAAPDNIRDRCGIRVLTLVEELTDAAKCSDGNRAKRAEINRNKLRTISPDGATIKLADIIDNTRDIGKHDRSFATLYLEEKWMVLPLLRYGDKELFGRVMAQMDYEELMLRSSLP